MGSFIGHALPGTFFILFAFWWIANMFLRYFDTRRTNSKFTSSATYNCRCPCGRFKDLPTEAFVKLLFVSIGTVIEGVCGIKDYKKGSDSENNLQHVTMFLMFGLNGVIDILLHLKVSIPANSDYVSLALAVLSEGILFKFHLHGRTDLDVLVHILLVYTLAASVCTILIEMKYRHNIMAALSRPYFTLLQGTWFWQAGWILYPPFPWSFKWDEEDHGQMMIATTIFIWHLAIDFIIMLAIGCVVSCFHSRCYSRRPGDTESNRKRINSEIKDEISMKLLDDDMESVESDT